MFSIKGVKILAKTMIKFLVIILSITSVSATGYSTYYSYNSKTRQGYSDSYKQKIDPAKSLIKKQTILSELQKTVAYNHKICGNRQECLRVDMQSLRQVQKKYRDSYDVQEFFQDITQELQHSADADVAVTELDVYKSMPDPVKQQYLQGVRMNDPQQAVRSLTAKYSRDPSSENSLPANSKIKFNVEDLKIYLLQKIEENHETCESRNKCFESDLEIAAEVAQNINDTDPGVGAFTQLVPTMKRNAYKQPFDTEKFYSLYHDALVHRYSMLYKSSERIQWTELVKNIDTIHPRDPHITNADKVQEKAKFENKMKHDLKKKGTDLANNFFDQIVGGETSDQKGKSLFDGLFGK